MKAQTNKIHLIFALLFVFTISSGLQAQENVDESDQDIVLLDPFEITATAVKGYMATNTISGTAMNTLLKDVPMSINVITSEFLEDSMVHGDLNEAFDYNSSITQTNRQPISSRSGIIAIRGFRNPSSLILLDGVLGGEFVPPWMIDRIEVVKGPNTLYGQSDPGGLINIITKKPGAENKASVTTKIGDNGFFEVNTDFTSRSDDGKLGIRLLGAHRESDGWRPVDGKETNYVGVTGDYAATEKTKFLFHFSGSKTQGIPIQRATWSFERIPTDLNGDGDTDDRVNGVVEATARFNNTFIPRNYTTATKNNIFKQENDYVNLGIRQIITNDAQVQYIFSRTDQDLFVTFREYNTFGPDGNAGGNHAVNQPHSRTFAHTLNTHILLNTGGVRHKILLGARYTDDRRDQDSYRLRTARAAEKAVLEDLIAGGRNIRLTLTKDAVLAGEQIWLDEIPTAEEIIALGARNNNTAKNVSKITTLYATDLLTLMDDRLKLLFGVRNIQIKQQTTDTSGLPIGNTVDKGDTSFQAGSVYDITKSVGVFVNYATSFNPNSRIDDITGDFFAPEESEAFEIGLKFVDFLGGKISGSMAYFDIKKDNVVRADFNPITFSNDVEVSGDESKGFEVELFLNPTPNWQTVVGYSYTDAKVVESRTEALNLALEGATPHRFTLWTNYRFEEGPLKGFRFGGGVIWADGPIQQFGTSANQFVVEDGYTVIDLFARYTTRMWDRNVTFGINVDNANDEFFVRSRAATNEARQFIFSVRVEL